MARRRTRGRTFIQRSREATAEQKALYHQVEGAGRSRVKRPFFGLTESEADEILKRLEAWIDSGLQRV